MNIKSVTTTAIIIALYLAPTSIHASEFSKGPLIKEFGPNAVVEQTTPVKATQKFMVSYDVAETPGSERMNNRYNSLARFLNMHVRAGVPKENIQLALVVHGDASNDLLSKEAYEERYSAENPNVELLNTLMEHGVKIYVCGQSATYHKINNRDLLPGVEMALSAMTTHALLQQQGYTLNPF